MKKYRVQFEIDEVVEAENREDAINEAIGKAIGSSWLDKAKLEEKNKIWSELAENLLCLEEEKWENLVKNGTKEQQLDFLRHKEKYSLLAVFDKYVQLRDLLKECLPLISAEIMTWQIRGGEESRKRGQDLLTRINIAIGESED